MPKAMALVISVLGVSVCCLALAVLSATQPEYASTYGWMALVAALIGIAARKILTGETPWWSPHAFVLATMFLYWVVASAAMVFYRVDSQAFHRMNSPRELNAGMLVVLLTMLGYLIGFRFGPKPKHFPARLEWFFADTPAVQARFNMVTMALFVIGMAAWAFTFISVGGVMAHMQNLGDRQQTVGAAGGIALHLTKWAYVGFFLYLSRNGVRVTTIAMFGVLLMIYLIFGSRSWVAMFLVGVAIIYRMRFGKIPNIVWPVLVGAIAFMQAFLVLLRATRGNFAHAEHIFSRRMQSTEGTVLSFLGDFGFLPNLADLAVSMGTLVPYQWGKTYLGFFYVIPQIFWNPMEYLPTAPGVYMQYLTPEQVGYVSIGPTLVGEGIMNFGWPGALLVSMVFGVICRWFQSAALTHPGRRFQVAIPVAVAMVSTEIMAYIKQGSPETTLLVYLTIPLIIPYLPNLTYLTGGAPRMAPARA